jgi:hypothetical protein
LTPKHTAVAFNRRVLQVVGSQVTSDDEKTFNIGQIENAERCIYTSNSLADEQMAIIKNHFARKTGSPSEVRETAWKFFRAMNGTLPGSFPAVAGILPGHFSRYTAGQTPAMSPAVRQITRRMAAGNAASSPPKIRRRTGGRRILRWRRGSASHVKRRLAASQIRQIILCNDCTVARAGSDKIWFK